MDKPSNKILFYNPGYEVSAGYKLKNYTPPRNVVTLRRDLACLMKLLYPHPNAVVWTPSYRFRKNDILIPWGWAPEVYSLPTIHNENIPYTLEQMQYFASRKRSHNLQELLVKKYPKRFTSNTKSQLLSQIRNLDFNEEETKRYIVKPEFSSSGRGQLLYNSINEILLQHTKKNREEYFIEVFHHKIQDRGLEFHIDSNGHIEYLGPSVFTTTNNQYTGNVIKPAKEIERQWLLDDLGQHTNYLEGLLSGLKDFDFNGYVGPFGIDTILYNANNKTLKLHPCIEINMRHTMGHIALKLSEWASKSGMEGYFSILYGKPEELKKEFFNSTFIDACNLTCKATAGNFHLNPIKEETQFVAKLHLKPIQYP